MSPVSLVILWSLVIAIGAYQVFVTVRLARSVVFSPRQKTWQGLLVWLVPLVGATIVHWFVTSSSRALPQSDRNFIEQHPNPPGIRRVRL